MIENQQKELVALRENHKEEITALHVYEMPKAGPRLSKEVLLYKLCEETLCFPKEIDDRSLVKMIEEGCIQ